MAGPPWIDPERMQGMALRDGDVWISVPAKSGTNWTMNIVHQLLTGGNPNFESIYHVVPWPEFLDHPGQAAQVLHDRVASFPPDQRRAFKSHSAPPQLPFVKAGSGEDVKYIAVCRDPEEALVSFKLFLDQHTDAFYDMWQVPRAAMTRPSFEAFYREVMDARGMQGMFFGFVAGWWPLRHEPNVLMLHYADMKRDLQGVVRKIASFLDVQLSAAQWASVERYVSFEWMKEHEDKFEIIGHAPVRVLEKGSMVRKGKLGAAHEDGMTREVAEHLRAFGSRILNDSAAMNWLYSGGPLP